MRIFTHNFNMQKKKKILDIELHSSKNKPLFFLPSFEIDFI